MYACVYTCIYVCIDINMWECKYIFVWIDMHGYACMCMYSCMYVYGHKYVYIKLLLVQYNYTSKR